ncbi:TonB-dependent receptor [Luteithermobacter gelatinilyticus]|uniref:TonB-dependent receptor n=1 Tax=Luteithermobacter gelatinilyticus TaxID=2582913 RepID=UPI0011070A61|nr:TonB-dependent receptor [Luteithermobacter gelatinilyticus]
MPDLSASRLFCLLFSAAASVGVTALPAISDDGAPAHDHGHEMEEIFATAAPHEKNRMDVLQGNSLLSGEDLDRRMAGTIGETLSGMPGISSTYFGPGASRPIIRGLGGDRIRVLINGIGSIDAASTSPDHAVAGDPLTAERVEVLRGASTLIYGNNAIGGVVNIIDNRIPAALPEAGFEGRARLGYETAGEDISGGAAITSAVGNRFALHLNGYFRNSEDYDIPGKAESERLHAAEGHDDSSLENETSGTVENSDVDNKGGAVGFGWFGENAKLGASFSLNDSNYGVPGGHGHEEEDHEEEDHEEEVVRIDLDQKRFDLAGEITRDFAIFQTARLRFGYADYEHKELEGEAIGTRFLNEGWEGRLELIQKDMEKLHGSMGLQIRKRNFKAIGDEAFVPPSETLQWGVFAVEEVVLDPLTLEFGARFDHQNTENKTLGIDRSFNSISLSAGAAYHPTDDSLVGLSLSHTERAPTPEELFSNGPHLATNAFERGNIGLDKEKGITAELTLKKESETFRGSLNLYHSWYQDFIFEQETGEDIDGLRVFEFRQQDARFYGAEVEAEWTLFQKGLHQVSLDVAGDYVRAKFTDNGGNVPRIPPLSATLGLNYIGEALEARAEVRFVDDQNKIGANELATDGYTELNLELGWQPAEAIPELMVRLAAENLTDAERRTHTSFLKDRVPLPGRNFKLSLTYGF